VDAIRQSRMVWRIFLAALALIAGRKLPRDNQGETAYCLIQLCSRSSVTEWPLSVAMLRTAHLSFPAWQPLGGARRRRQGWPSLQPGRELRR
jgi:hypothetical protein